VDDVNLDPLVERDMMAEMIRARDARIAALEADAGRLKALVIGAFDILTNCGALSGVCCCGEDMETHSSPMFAGHSPVDQGAFAASYWLETARALLTDGGNDERI